MIRLVAFFLFIGLLTVNAETYSQHVSVDIKNGNLTDLFQEIQEQSDFVFFYNDKLVKEKVVSVSLQNVNIRQLLKKVLPEQHLDYTISGNQITIKPNTRNQQRTIQGTVRDAKGVPLASVNVLVKGSNMGAITDDEGHYRLSITGDVTLIFSMVGYRDTEISTQDRTRVDAVLQEETKDLEEVVVMGYSTIDKQHVASSVASMDMDRATNRPIFKLQEAFSGTLPGVTLTQTTNMPGVTPGTISIRGRSTLQNAAPLVIVDGMEQTLTDIDPNQVKSISVLKDAASASLYGSRGANGVIIIETKRGVTGRFKVDLHHWSAFSDPIDLPDLVNAADYMRLNNEARGTQGQTLLFDEEDIAAADRGDFVQTDWLDAIMRRRAQAYNTTANISGGGGVGTFNLMLGYVNQGGLNAHEGTEKFSARFNTNINIDDKFVLLADFYAHRLQVNQLQIVNLADNARDDPDTHWLYLDARKMNPTQSVYYDSDMPNHYILHNNINPIASVDRGGQRSNMYDRSTINLRPRYFITSDLSVEGNVSYMINRSASKIKRETTMFYDGDGRPAATWANHTHARQGVSVSQLTARANVNYEKSLRQDKDKLYFIAGSEIMSYNYTDYREVSKASFFGKLNYSFDNRYILEATARSDGSSKFAPGHRWGFFPSAALAWNVHNESFMLGALESGTINNLKIRASYGLIGNENVDPYLWQEIVNTWGWVIRVPNPEFSWEKQKQWNVGMDLTTLDNRLNVTAEVYKKHSYDLIFDEFPIPPLIGASVLESAVNIGEVENKGWELSASWSDRVGKFSYRIGGMLFNNENRVLKAGYSTSDTLIFKGNADRIWYRGIALNNYYGYENNGYFQTQEEIDGTSAKLPNTMPGDIRYVDQNGDGIINEDDRVDLGNPFPRMNYSVTLDLRYGRWDFNMLGQGVGRSTGRLSGLEGYPVLMDGTNNSLGTPRQEYMDNRWTPETPDSRFPRVWTGQSSNAVLSNVWLSNAAFFRVKTLQLGYTIPNIGKGIQNLRIYLNAQDALTFTKWEGLDPERNGGEGSYPHGGDGSYPRMATYSIGIRASIL
ncbi:SusC/RagA family TonB-linked outer membrane protein [Parapedobacter tibetensis]|uniref:SusC/RagA family TonB-linked outer membrane protein n=1 Tax=Parapedobacter tibetensis TaxID=2972951 RepID=UPI00214D7D7A|nr:SusC/RagA family TonB-linked outer membrane protein [Parapedobacter tibetensis]